MVNFKGRWWYRLVYPLALLTASVIRVNVISLLYLLGFMSFMLTTPSQPGESPSLIHTICTVIFTTIVLIGHCIFQILVATVAKSSELSDSWAIWGYHRFNDGAWNAVRTILPDAILLAVSVVTLIGLRARARRHTKKPAQSHLLSVKALSYCVSVTLLFAVSANPSLFSLLFAVVYLFCLFLWAFRFQLLSLLIRFVSVLAFISAGQLFVFYLYQFPSVSTSMGSDVADALGMFEFNIHDFSAWPRYLECMAVFFVFLSSIELRHVVALEHSSALLPHRPQQKMHVPLWWLRFLHRQGPLFVQLALFHWSFTYPSFSSLIFLLVAFIGLVSSARWFARYLMPYVFVFAMLLFLAQFTYNFKGLFYDPPPATETLLEQFGLYHFKKDGVDTALRRVSGITTTALVVSIIAVAVNMRTERPPALITTLRRRSVEVVEDVTAVDAKVLNEEELEEEKRGAVSGQDNTNTHTHTDTGIGSAVDTKQSTLRRIFITIRGLIFDFGAAILLHAHKFSLFLLFLDSIFQVDILHLGYLCLFITFLLFHKTSIARLWIVLVFYCQAVIATLFIWQILQLDEFDGGLWVTFFGLRRIENNLWFGLGWDVVLLGFLVLQLHVYHSGVYQGLSRMYQPHIGPEHNHGITTSQPPLAPADPLHAGRMLVPAASPTSDIDGGTLSLVVSAQDGDTQRHADAHRRGGEWEEEEEADEQAAAPESSDIFARIFYQYGLWMCYVALLVVGLLPPVNISSFFYLVFLVVCITIQQFSLSQTVTKQRLRRFWIIIVIYAVIVLLMRYIYMLKPVSTSLSKVFPKLSINFTLKDIGLDDALSVAKLFSNGLVLTLSIFQFRSFGEMTPPPGRSLVEQFPDSPFVKRLVRIKERFMFELKIWLYRHTSKLTLLTVFLVAVSSVSFANFLYTFILIVILLFEHETRWHDAWAPLGIYGTLLILTQYIVQFPAFTPFTGGDLHWIGFQQFEDQNIVQTILGNLCVILICILQRQSQEWQSLGRSTDQRSIDQLVSEEGWDPPSLSPPLSPKRKDPALAAIDSSSRLMSEEEKARAREKGFMYESASEDEEAVHTALALTTNKKKRFKLFRKERRIKIKKFFTQAYLGLSDIWPKMGFEISLCALVLAGFVRLNMLSVCYVLLAGVFHFIRWSRRVIAHLWRVLILLMITAITGQYLVLLYFPPGWNMVRPWRTWTFDCEAGDDQDSCQLAWQQWLTLGGFNSSLLTADFLALFLMVMQQLYFNYPTEIWNSGAQQTLHVAGDSNDFTIPHNRKSYWQTISFMIFCHFHHLVLVVVFVAGCMGNFSGMGDLNSFGYFCFALWFLLRSEALMASGYSLWRWLRYYNFFSLLIHICFQIPALPCPVYMGEARTFVPVDQCHRITSELVVPVDGDAWYFVVVRCLGLFKLQAGEWYTWSGSFPFLVIFLLADLQRQIFEHPYYTVYVLGYLQREHKLAEVRAKEYVIKFNANRYKQHQAVEIAKGVLRSRLGRIINILHRWQLIWQHKATYPTEEEEKVNKRQSAAEQLALNGFAMDDCIFALSQCDDDEKKALRMLRGLPLDVEEEDTAEAGYESDSDSDNELAIDDNTENVIQPVTAQPLDSSPVGEPLSPRIQVAPSTSMIPAPRLPLESIEPGSPTAPSRAATGQRSPKKSIFGRFKKGSKSDIETPPALPSPAENVAQLDSSVTSAVEPVQGVAATGTGEEIVLKSSKGERSDAWSDFWHQFRSSLRRALRSQVDETLFYDPSKTAAERSEEELAQAADWLVLSAAFLQSHTKWLVFLMFVINHIINANLISMLLVLSAFGYAIMENPFPPRRYWQFCLLYVIVVLYIKFIYQFPIFCGTPPFSVFSAPQCAAPAVYSTLPFRWDSVVGIRKFAGPSSYPSEQGFVAAILPEFFVLLSLLLHRAMLQKGGVWHFTDTSRRELLVYTHPDRRSSYASYSSVDSDELDATGLSASKRSKAVSWPERSNSGLYSSRLEVIVDPRSKEAPQTPQTPKSGADPGSESTAGNRTLKGFFLDYYWKLLFSEPAVKPGRDLYSWFFTFSLILVLYVLFFFSAMSGNGSDLTQSLQKNQFSAGMVIALLLMISLVMVDRILYKLRTSTQAVHSNRSRYAVTLKLCLNYCTLIVVHLETFFLLPRQSDRPFYSSASLVIFYLLFCLYWLFSSLQIHFGYPEFTRGQSLTDSTNTANRTAFKIYRAVPFLYELRGILDWTVTRTSLDLFQWFKMEDAYSNLYTTKCDMEERKSKDQGDPEPTSRKILFGCCFVFALMIVILGPILMFSNLNPITESNLVQSAEISLDLIAHQTSGNVESEAVYNLFHVARVNAVQLNDQQVRALSQSYSWIKPEWTGQVQKISLAPYSDTVWTITPPSFDDLIKKLISPGEMSMRITYLFKRDLPPGAEVAQGVRDVPMESDVKQALYNVLTSDDPNNGPSLHVLNLYPRFFRLGSSTVPTSLGEDNHTYANCYVHMESKNGVRYWAVQSDISDSASLVERGDGITFVTYSDEVLGSFVSGASSISIVGLYATVVLTIGKFLRIFFDKASQRVIYEEMPNGGDLMEVCEGVYIARLEGDLKREEELYDQLIKIYRSPETLLQITGTDLNRKKVT